MARKTGGREATTGVIEGQYVLGVGNPGTPAPEGWRWTALTDVARLESGHTPSRKKPEYWGGKIPWIGIKDATGNHGRTIHETMQHTNDLGIANSAARVLPANTVCLSRTASVGYVVIMGRPMATSQDFANWVCSDKLDYRYLKFALLAERDSFSRFSYGSTHQTIYYPELKAFHICLPPVAEQKRIADILQSLDDKIELNRRMSTTLEEMARALYRSWFVDFDPVHAHALGQPPAHMDATTAALFPDSFGPDGLPKGWERKPLAKHVRATRGLSYKGKHLCGPGDGVPLHNLNSIYEGGGYKGEGAKYYDGDFKPRHEIRPGDLIVANTEQSFGLELIGHAALVPSWFGPSGILSQHLYKVEIKEGSPLSKEWLYLALSIAPLGVEIRGFSNGTTVNMLPADAFEIPETAIPPAAIVEKMNEIVRPAFAQQERLREESRTLATLRDTLLPRLMSGDLRIREAERQVEAVV